MRILAFHPGVHDSSAAAFEDYRLIAAVQEERLTRVKGAGDGVPWLAIDEVLRIADWTRRDVDAIASTRAFYPSFYLRAPLQSAPEHRRQVWRECQRCHTTDPHAVFAAERFLDLNGFRADTQYFFANHHEAHALPTFFFTDWQDALLFTADGSGDNVNYSMRTFKDGELNCQFGDDRSLLSRYDANGIGMAYGIATELCGFRQLRHEGKITGLAAFGEPTLAAELAQGFHLGDDGVITSKFGSWTEMSEGITRICAGAGRETIAASIQKVTEDLMMKVIRHWLVRSNVRHLGLGGGVFANVRLNRVLAENCPVDELFIFPAMGDDGLCIGAALSFLLARDDLPIWLDKRYRLDTIYLGRDYDGDIDAQLISTGCLRRQPSMPIKAAIERIVAGQVGGAYLGRMEFGPRALGARSIIANPSNHGINNDLNRRLDRSEFMPFAPYVLDEDADKVFDVTPINRYAARFMTITCSVRPEWQGKIPAVVHVDGTARPQIVRERENPLYAAILRGFRDRTGVPVLINTSFNVHEEPVVNRPAECVRELLDGRVDFVVTQQALYSR